MLRFWRILYCISCILVCTVSLKTLRIALHAQLYPSEEKVVGSVITTNGLKAALQNRHDVSEVDIFYPTRYDGFLNRTWDMILIEGWFPSITSFLRLARNNFPQSCIVFICLDPTYPGLEVVQSFAIDGIVTNSIKLIDYFSQDFLTEYMMLAADPVIMKPDTSVRRDWGAVYVGAGGHMLQVKPELRELLLQALPYRLRLHGSNWENVPEFKEVSLGTLPQMDLASAYSSAHIVLASTIQSQSLYSMVNNRIFEALSCGAMVVSWFSTELKDLSCDAILFINHTYTINDHMKRILSNRDYAEELHRSAREFIIKKHTWSHRTVQLIDFYHYISNSMQNFQPKISSPFVTHKYHICGRIQCKTNNCPTLLWLVSSELLQHTDYIFVGQSIAILHLCSVFNITIYDSILAFDDEYKEEFYKFDVILSFITPFDELDLRMRSLNRITKPDATFPSATPHLQRHVCYIIGYNPAYVIDYIHKRNLVDVIDTAGIQWNHYDAVWYRSSMEVEMLAQLGMQLPSAGRWQQMFGIGNTADAIRQGSAEGGDKSKMMAQRVVVVCWIQHAQLCSTDNRARIVSIVYKDYLKVEVTADGTGHSTGQDSFRKGGVERDELSPEYMLLLLGGQWNDWLDYTEGSNNESILQYSDLHRIIHVRTGWTGDAVNVIQTAEVAVVMNSPDFFDGMDVLSTCDHPPLDSSDQSSFASSDHPSIDSLEEFPSSVHHMLRVLQCQRTVQSATTEDMFWPYIAAAVSNTRIHLFHPNRHLMYMLSHPSVSSVDAWNTEFFMENMIKIGTNRLLGLGSRHSKFALRILSSSESDDNIMDTAFYQSFQSSHVFHHHQPPSASASHSKQDITENSVEIVFLELSYENFEVGRDGEACIEQQYVTVALPPHGKRNSSLFNLPGDRICLMRPYRYLVLQRYEDIYHYCIYTDSSSTDIMDINSTNSSILTFFLRGSFFGDPFYSFDKNIQNIYKNNRNNVNIPVLPIPIQWNTTWLTKHSVFVYNLLKC